MQNGQYIRKNLANPTFRVESVLDEVYAETVEKKLASLV